VIEKGFSLNEESLDGWSGFGKVCVVLDVVTNFVRG